LETAFFTQLRRARDPVAPVAAGTRVLFFASRQERDQVAVATTLAWALQRRGAQVSLLACDGALTKSCNTGYYPKLDPWVCRSCHLYAAHAHQLSGLDVEWL